MSLHGTFSTMPFPDLLQWLGDSGRSGLLSVSLDFEDRLLRIQGGQVVALGSIDPRSRDLARLALARGLIDEVRLRRILVERARSGRPLRSVLVEDGHVAAASLSAAVRAWVKDVTLQVFLWAEGRFVFGDMPESSLLAEPKGPDEELAVDPSIPARELAIDGMRRLDEWRRMVEVLPGDDAIVLALGHAADLPALEALADSGEPMALGDLCLALARPRFDVLAELFEARRRGLLAIESAPPATGRPRVDPSASLLESARVLLAEEQFEEAAALCKVALEVDPYRPEARELMVQARAGQVESLYQQYPPYRVPVPNYDRASIATLPLLPKERYLAQRIDGQRDVGVLTVMTPLGELETLRLLKKLQNLGLIAFA